MENLGVDPKLLLAQLINFGLFFFLFSKFIAKPFMQYIENEKKKDLERQRVSELALKQEEELEVHKKKISDKMNKEFNVAIEEARKDALELKKQLIAEAKKDAEEIVLKAEKEITTSQSLMEKEMKDKVSSLSIILVSKVLKDYLSEDIQKAVTARVISNLSQSKQN
ncbi:hypothetical protein COY87_01825 [Candidatus Roizmanbacteria bacterium CG_4_10_14_0_8_um_filter_33_9]|uniref:ATP synthase subunit b n=1 Tax=Candidatus Roizmanbacteria bacterium CG_4_10_14_0_8_um_filter_33_9 TaxID=1974826 RepID=A0A2M7QIY1_9BACT|nr:MAG: hypothetical protein COY87_01825 [Candidatus Roizmanbacteria bacterium CG_4_10_14_0_8_um_filter_33_9]